LGERDAAEKIVKSRIIIVEDDKIIAKDIKSTIEANGYNVVGMASSGEEAILKVGDKRPDIVIMDVKLKGELDGIDAALQIKALYDTPVVFLTSYVDNKTIARAKITGPMGYILKPFEEIELCTALEIALYKDLLDKKMRDNERWLSTILTSIGDAVIATDRDGYIKFMNPVAEALTGWTVERTINRSLGEVFNIKDAESGDPIASPLERVRVTAVAGEPGRTTILIRRDGSEIPIAENVAPIKDHQGAFSGAVIVFSDITSRKRMEDYLRLTKEHAEAASKEKNRFLAHISHEIRTPLNAITGFAELLRKTPLSDLQKDYLSTIYESGDVLLALIDDVLDISRIEAGGMRLQSEIFDMEYIVQNVIKMLRLKLKGNRVIFNVDFDPQAAVDFMGDATRVRQILLNLLNNAIKFTPRGEIFVKIFIDDEAEKESELDKKALTIIVGDTGIGIPFDKQKIIFEAFAQADTSRTRKYGGTGLGLTITKAIVEKMGGTISFTSQEGKGTEFRVTLRLQRGAQEAPGEREDVSPYLADRVKGKKVLLIDENSNSRNIIQKHIEMAGMSLLFSASTIRAALEWIHRASEKPECIIIDVEPHEELSLDMVDLFREKDTREHLKIIGITTAMNPRSSSRARESGFDMFLSRPVLWKEFQRCLEIVFLGIEQKVAADRTDDEGPPDLKGLKVLLVEDNVINQKLQKIILMKFGCDVVVASNGQEAIDKTVEGVFDAVFMDVSMPVLGGIDATAEIRKRVGAGLPIIAVTAYAGKEDREKCLEVGMNDFIAKPIRAIELRDILLKWVKRPAMPERKSFRKGAAHQ
jgi:two-component system, sensor histidine kinase and response regulator